MLDKEARRELKQYRTELRKKALQKKYLLNKEADFGLLEDLVRECNNNPNLQVTVVLGDGTKLELVTVDKKRFGNPLFQEQFDQSDMF